MCYRLYHVVMENKTLLCHRSYHYVAEKCDVDLIMKEVDLDIEWVDLDIFDMSDVEEMLQEGLERRSRADEKASDILQCMAAQKQFQQQN